MPSGVTLRTFVVSRFALDGGAMHGIVPRPLWERIHTPDERNRIALVARCLLVDHQPSGSRTLIELGMGQRWTDKERDIYALERAPEVPEQLARGGVDPETITHVVLTHLHWDHAGGLVRADTDRPELAFPRAEHVVGEACLAYLHAASEKDAGSFRPADLDVLMQGGKVRTWREGEPLAPGVEGRLSHGHTTGLVVPWIRARDDGPPVAMPADLVPTRSHLKVRWVAAYDNDPTRAVVEKRALIDDLAAVGGGVVLYHDPEVEAAWAVPTAGGAELRPGPLSGPRA